MPRRVLVPDGLRFVPLLATDEDLQMTHAWPRAKAIVPQAMRLEAKR